MTTQLRDKLFEMDSIDPAVILETVTNLIAANKKPGLMTKDILGFSDKLIEDIYAMAYFLYQNNNVKGALDFFQHLVNLDINSFKFAFGLAACYQQLKMPKEAVTWYIVAHVNDPISPLPALFAAICYMDIEAWHSSLFYCQKALELSNNKPAFKYVHDHANIIKQVLEGKGK